MELKLQHQRVVVFGAARGIGLAIAECFSREGAQVVAVDREPAGDLPHQDAGPQIEFVCGDVTSLEQMQSLAERFPDTQHVVFSVGASSGKVGFPFWNVHPSLWQRVLDINLIGAVNVAHAFAPALAERRQGSMLFLSSVAGQIGSQTDPPYSAAKAGLINFMQCAARDLASSGVRVNAISPGMVQTDLNRSVWEASRAGAATDANQTYESWGEEKIRRIAPLGRWQAPAEIAALAAFLASEHARNITGQTFNVDGGQVMHA